MYVIRHSETGKYVAFPGSERTYTTKLDNMRIFDSRKAAEASACSNERVEEY